ncbi:MAG: uL15 family ribosomal protein [Candidatus Pacearchaeota archaeon]
MKTHKRKKVSRMHGRHAGTHGWGARKKHKKSGHRGGIGMAGSGKRADQKKTLVLKLYGHNYFGKQGVTSRGTKRDKRKRININQIDSNIENYIKKGLAKKTSNGIEINLEGYKILSGDKNYKIKNKLIIKADESSKSALENVKKAGGEIILSKTGTIEK